MVNENLKPLTHNLDGNRNMFSLAGDWRITRDSVLEFEIERSHKTQPSQNGFSLLGNTLPAPVDPKINLNNQPWSQPSEFNALTGSVRFSQALNADWRWSAQIGQQRLKTDDRLAYAFGCGAEGNYDRYCSDGTFDFYDFRSENERRTQTAGSLNLKGNVMTGSVRHELGFGLLASRVRNRFQDQAYNYVGTGNIWATAIVPADPTLTASPTPTATSARPSFRCRTPFAGTSRFTTWVGLRHTRLDREQHSAPTARAPPATRTASPRHGLPPATPSSPGCWHTQAGARAWSRRWCRTRARSTPTPAKRFPHSPPASGSLGSRAAVTFSTGSLRGSTSSAR